MLIFHLSQSHERAGNGSGYQSSNFGRELILNFERICRFARSWGQSFTFTRQDSFKHPPYLVFELANVDEESSKVNEKRGCSNIPDGKENKLSQLQTAEPLASVLSVST